MSDGRKIVCALATEPNVPQGSVFDRVCSRCGDAVMVAPSGQRSLAEDPELQILCTGCFFWVVQPGDEFAPAPGALDEMREFFKDKKDR